MAIYMLKYLGLALVFAGCALTGWDAVAAVKQTLRLTSSLLRLIAHIQNEIDCKSAPLSDIFASFKDDALEACGFTGTMNRSGLREAVSELSDRLDAEAVDIMKDFSAGLGCCGREGQLTLCQNAASRMKAVRERLAADAPRKTKLYASLGVTAALTMIIIII